MQIKLVFFSVLQEILKQSEMFYEVTDPCSCEDLLNQLQREYGLDSILNDSYLARNGVYAFRDTLIAEGDEIAIIPPAGASEARKQA